MSLIKCDECKELIDSDLDPDCFIEKGGDWVVKCEVCRGVFDHD